MSDTVRLAKEIDETSRKHALLLGQLLDRLVEKEASEKKAIGQDQGFGVQPFFVAL